MRRIVGLLVVLILTLTVIGCTGKGTGDSSHPMIPDAQQRLPFQLVLPEYLPTGYKLVDIKVNDNPPTGNRVQVDLVYQDDRGGSIHVTQSNYTVHIGGANVETIKIGNKSGEYQETRRTDATVRTVAFQVSAEVSVTILTLSLDRNELIRIAASMVR